MKRIVAMLAVLFIAAVTPVAADDHFFAYDLIFPDVYLQPGVTADINVLVLKNKDHRCRRGKTLFAVHGLANTANTWKPLAQELFSDNPIGQEVCSILAINLPGRGYSSLPKGEAGMLYGHLTLDDHVQAVIGTLERARRAGFFPRTIMAHSQGGLIVQMVQQALIESGSSLRAEFWIKKVFLMASIGPAAVPWYFAESGAGAAAVGQFLNDEDPELGMHVAIPDAAWPYLFFVDPSGSPAGNAPSAEEVTREGCNSPEPLFASLQLLGLDPFVRPWVDPGIFDKTGTNLEFVAMSQDSFQAFPDQEELGQQEAALYEYLTNDYSLKRFTVVESEDAVHSMYISNPRELLEALVPSNISLP